METVKVKEHKPYDHIERILKLPHQDFTTIYYDTGEVKKYKRL